MVVAVRISPPVKGRTPKLSMLELVTMVNTQYSNTKLRKRILPQGFCYVCSRIDPGGVFRNQNSYLFQKGFFHACEHQPQAPQTTFVGEEIKVDLKRDDTSTATGTGTATLTLAPSISVTIKHDRDSGRFGTPTRRNRTKLSSRDPTKGDKVTLTPSVKYSSGTSRLPPISGAASPKGDNLFERKAKSSTKSVPRTESTLRARTLSSIELRSPDIRSKQSGILKTASSARETDKSDRYSDRITIIPTALDDELTKSDGKSDVTATTATIPKTVEDRQTDTTDNNDVGHTQLGGPSESDLHEATPFINKSDGLGSIYSVEPLIKEVVMLGDERSHGNVHQRPVGARGKEKYHGTDTDTVTERPESGHLRYHHRNEEDSVPDPGFEMPPTPSVEERLQMEREEREERERKEHEEEERKEADRVELERLIAWGGSLGRDGVTDEGSVSDDVSLRLTERSGKSSRHRGPRNTLSSSSRKSFCRCPSETRESSFMKSSCLICGKGILYGNSRRSRESSIAQNEAGGGGATAGMRPTSSVSNRSRHQMLYQNKQNNIFKGQQKPRSESDEDYMDLDSIIHEDDGRYWSSDEDDYESQFMTRSAMLRYKNAKPFPLVDPNTHKLVYIKALNEARLRAYMDEEEDEFHVIDKLRHPHTFSYFPLLPGLRKEGDAGPTNIGLKPQDEEVHIKKGQFMRHIFGDIDMDKFYPKSSFGKVRKHSILDITDTALISTDRVSTTKPAGSPGAMANVPRDDERTSVSLKMRKSGVNFEDGP